MRKKIRYYIAFMTMTATLLVACTSSQNSRVESETTDTNNNTNESVTITTSDTITTSTVVIDREFTASDLDVGYEDSTATHIVLNETKIEVSGTGATSTGGVLTISDEGTYVITGALTDGQIVVDASDTDKIQIVLNGVSIKNEVNAPIYIKSADKVFITLQENTINTLIDGAEYVQTDEKNVDGVIYSRADLTFNGTGTLNITGNYKHGIISKDDLVITGGVYNITAVKDALNGKDCVKIKDGVFTLHATTGSGIQSKNGDDTTKGYVYISGGEINIIKCNEGIEGTVIIIEDGTINVIADDDGFNAASGTADTTDSTTSEAQKNGFGGKGQGSFGGGGKPFGVDANCYILVEGGNITIDASGDGIDSNGSLYILGGTVTVIGPTSGGDGGLDYDGTAEISGGTVMIAGSSGMAQGFSDTSTQYSLLYNLTTASEVGSKVELTDSKGNVVVSFIPSKQYQSVVISTPELTKDATYTLTCGEQTAEITLSDIVTSNGVQGMGGQGMGRPANGGQGMERPDKMGRLEGMERPEGTEIPEGMERPEGIENQQGIPNEEGTQSQEAIEGEENKTSVDTVPTP